MHTNGYDSVEQLQNLLDKTDEPVTTLANASAFLYALLGRVNWVGFYLLRGDELYLGPFQGKPACTRIRVGSGVCGAAVAEGKTQRVDDVHVFPGHIACDSASNSELVVLLRDETGSISGLLDIDSPDFSRFSEQDAAEMERAAELISAAIDWNGLRKTTAL